MREDFDKGYVSGVKWALETDGAELTRVAQSVLDCAHNRGWTQGFKTTQALLRENGVHGAQETGPRRNQARAIFDVGYLKGVEWALSHPLLATVHGDQDIPMNRGWTKGYLETQTALRRGDFYRTETTPATHYFEGRLHG